MWVHEELDDMFKQNWNVVCNGRAVTIWLESSIIDLLAKMIVVLHLQAFLTVSTQEGELGEGVRLLFQPFVGCA
jgi:hypothetical protein